MQPLHIDTIGQLLELTGDHDLRHPLFHILRLDSSLQLPTQFPVDFSFGFYTVGLLHDLSGPIQCGRRSYDFQKGTMFFLSPNQLVGHAVEALANAKGWLLFFHHSYLANHPLEKEINQYGFFEYVVNESLHLSTSEEAAMEQIFAHIHTEHQRPMDKYSRKVVVSNIALLLAYADRYFGRQFITRNDVESNFLIQFDALLNAHFQSVDGQPQTIPSVGHFAAQLHMSPKYLGDKLRVLTGKTAQEHIHLKLMEKAKVLLQQKTLSVSEVAYALGFEYPQYFSRLFKKRVGISPKVFQHLN